MWLRSNDGVRALERVVGHERGQPSEIYQDVAAHFNEQELSELTFAIAAINAWNRFGVGFAMQPK